MSAKTPSRRSAPRGKTSPVATQQKPRKNAAIATKARRQPSLAVASAAKTRPATKSTTPIDPFTKQSRLIALLRASAGATLDDMMALTGWQAHSVRGVISGVLRKKLGLKVTCEQPKDSDERRYRIVGAATAA